MCREFRQQEAKTAFGRWRNVLFNQNPTVNMNNTEKMSILGYEANVNVWICGVGVYHAKGNSAFFLFKKLKFQCPSAIQIQLPHMQHRYPPQQGNCDTDRLHQGLNCN